MNDVYLVQHKNGKTKVFVVDGLIAYLCRDGRVLHMEQFPKTGVSRSWIQYTLLPENSEVAVKARQCVFAHQSRKEFVRQQDLAASSATRKHHTRMANAERLRLAQLQVGDCLRVSHLRSYVLAKVVSVGRTVQISKFFRTQNVWMPKRKLSAGWTKVTLEQAEQFIHGAKWADVGVCGSCR